MGDGEQGEENKLIYCVGPLQKRRQDDLPAQLIPTDATWVVVDSVSEPLIPSSSRSEETNDMTGLRHQARQFLSVSTIMISHTEPQELKRL